MVDKALMDYVLLPNIARWRRGEKEMGTVFSAGPECRRCQGGKFQCSWQLADAGVGRFE